MPKNKKSAVWTLVTESSDPKYVLCNICNEKITRGGSSKQVMGTTNVRRHLLKHHSKQYLEAEKAKDDKLLEEAALKKQRKVSTFLSSRECPPAPSSLSTLITADTASSSSLDITASADMLYNHQLVRQQTMIECMETKKIWDVNDHRSKEIHFLIAEMVALDCQPISIVEDSGFINLIKFLRPNYPLPSRRYFTERIIPCVYNTALDFLRNVIENCQFISFSTDIWSTGKNMFISLTGHCVYPNFDQQAVLLHAAPFPTNHTGVHIENMIKKMVQDFGIPIDKIHQVVHDNASNMLAGVSATGYSSLSCFLHTTQLAINECILQQPQVRNIIEKSKKIAGHFNKSPLSCMNLIKIQKQINKKELAVMQDVATRWDSTHLMLKRMHEIKEEIIIFTSDNTNNCPYSFETNEWQLMKKIVDLLKVFHQITVR